MENCNLGPVEDSLLGMINPDDSMEEPDEQPVVALAASCPECGNQHEENELGFVPPMGLVRCECGHFVCQHCLKVCTGCYRRLCAGCIGLCVECCKPLCSDCAVVDPNDRYSTFHASCVPDDVQGSLDAEERGDQQYRASVGD